MSALAEQLAGAELAGLVAGVVDVEDLPFAADEGERPTVLLVSSVSTLPAPFAWALRTWRSKRCVPASFKPGDLHRERD